MTLFHCSLEHDQPYYLKYLGVLLVFHYSQCPFFNSVAKEGITKNEFLWIVCCQQMQGSNLKQIADKGPVKNNLCFMQPKLSCNQGVSPVCFPG